VESQVQEVKARTDIISLISGYISLKKAGRNYKGLCPFHAEKTPSFMVSPERQIFKCFGCGEGGDVFAFYQKIEGVEFSEAFKNLAAKAGVQLKGYKPNPRDQQKEVINQINTTAARLFHYLLTEHISGKKALEYLHDRGVNDQSIKDWSLGWAPDSWDSAFKFLTKKKFSSQDVIASGVALPSQRQGAYDRFRKRIIFPIRNVSGLVVGFSGRILGEGEPKYLNSPDNLVFNKSNNLYGLDLAKVEIKKENEAVLVEGNLDVISSHQVGVKNVVAPLGTALTEKQVELLRRFGEGLIISFDQDLAGEHASQRGVELAERVGLAVKLTDLGEKDPDELIKKDPKLWKEALQKSVPIYDYLINSAVKRYGTSTSNAINKITREVIPFIGRIGNEITRSHYERLLAGKLGVSEGSVSKEVGKAEPASSASYEANSEKGEKVSLEKYLLALVLQNQILPNKLKAKEIEDEAVRAILELAEKEGDNFTLEALAKKLPAELEGVFNEATLIELPSEILKNEEKIRGEIDSCGARLKELNLRARLKALSLNIKQAEINKKAQVVKNLSETFKVLSQELSTIEKVKAGE